jgi:endonuclease YncB( thermonuclease family)
MSSRDIDVLGLDFKKPHRKKGLWSLIVLLCLVVAALILTLVMATAGPARLSGSVQRTIDGDTFRLQDLEPSIRIWGLDAPERGQPGGAEATNMLQNLIQGQTMTCRIRDIDRYDRIVGQCFLSDGQDIAAEMIEARVAREYCRYSGGYYGTC